MVSLTHGFFILKSLLHYLLNFWSLHHLLYQKKFTATKLKPTKVSSLGCRKRRGFIQVNSLQTREMQLLAEAKGVLPLEKEGAYFLYRRSGCPGFLIGSFKWKIWIPHLHPFIGSNCTVLICWNNVFWLVTMQPLWLSGKFSNLYIAMQLLLDREDLSPLIEIDSRNSLLRIDSNRDTVQEAGSLVCGFFLKCRVHRGLYQQ